MFVGQQAKSDIKTLKDFVAQGQGESEAADLCVVRPVGASGTWWREFFGQEAGSSSSIMPYKGAAQGLIDLVGGHIVFSAQTVTSAAGRFAAAR